MSYENMVVIRGDAQAHGIAMLFEQLEPLRSASRVLFVNTTNERPEAAFRSSDFRRGTILLDQVSDQYVNEKVPGNLRRVTFPSMRLNLLWPLEGPNPYNRADTVHSLGPYPLGNKYIVSGIERGEPADEIVRAFQAGTWSDTWPNLDALFRLETAALLGADAKCDVKIGSFILKYFRRRRLFWGPNAPSNELLGELAYRILHTCFGLETPVDREAIQRAFTQMSGVRDVMAHIAVPVHPIVASHFSLEWYDPQERYPSLQGNRSFDEYYQGMIEYILARRSEENSVTRADG